MLIHLLLNTLFPLGPGLPFRPSGPLFPFKEVQMLMTVTEHQYQLHQNPHIQDSICAGVTLYDVLIFIVVIGEMSKSESKNDMMKLCDEVKYFNLFHLQI